MTFHKSRIAALAALLAITAVASHASADFVSIDGTANIFGAGHAIPPAPGGGTGGTLPPAYLLPAVQAGDFVTVGGVVGEVSCCDNVFNGADGGGFASGNTDITSYGGISGIIHQNRTMFLVGMFTNGTEPMDPAPARLDFTGADDFAAISPVLNQTFFVGDGLTGTGMGLTQQFFIPAGATHLYLGFADGFNFGNPTSPPGWYNDNGGTLRADINVVPEPGTLTLLIIAGAVAIRRRRA